MGRKIDIKMIENATRRQVTYSKRRTSLIKKAHELSVFCDIDVLLLVFSPSRRVSAYCSRTSLEDLLERFINLPTVKKHEKNPNMKNVAEKLERLKGIESISDDENKLHYLKNRINHLELQAKKFKIDLELLSASIRNFEPSIEEEDPVAQAKLCLRSLKYSLQKLSDRKNVLLGNHPSLMNGQSSSGDLLGTYDDMRKSIATADEDLLFAYNFGGVELRRRPQNRTSTRLLTQLDPWLSPFSNKARERILEGASVQLGNAYTRFPSSVPTFPSMPPLQSQSPTVTKGYVLPSPPLPPYDRSFRRPMPTNWMVPPPPARYNQQQGALEKQFTSYSNRKNGEVSSSHFQKNPNDQEGIRKSIEFVVQPNQPLVPNQQSYKNQNDSSPVVFNVHDGSSNLMGQILSHHQLCINNVDQYAREVTKVNDNASADDHVGDFLLQHQQEDNGKSNDNSNEVSQENENSTSPNIDEILTIQDLETELISLDALFEEIEKMATEKEGNQDSASIEWDGFALAESLNETNFNIIN